MPSSIWPFARGIVVDQIYETTLSRPFGAGHRGVLVESKRQLGKTCKRYDRSSLFFVAK